MSDLFGISVSALQAFQQAIQVTSNNIANSNTPGYSVESIDLTTAVPQGSGATAIGNGVQVASINRAFSQATQNQLVASQSSLGQLNALQGYTNQIDNIVGSSGGGLTTALTGYYNAWSALANDPTSTAARQSLLSQAQNVAQTFQNSSTQLQSLNANINTGITADVNQINAIATSIAKLNVQISVGGAQAGGQAPNTLLDQRDQLLSSLSQLVGVSTTTDNSGALNVFVANGQPLVLAGTATPLTTVPNQYNASQLDVSTANSGGNSISASITSGDLGGLLAARNQAVNPALNQLGQIALAVQSSANTVQNSGLDLNGNFGANIFGNAGPLVAASLNNTGAATASATVTNVGALTTDNYLLTYKGAGAYSLTDTTTGGNVALTGQGTALSPLLAPSVGLSVVLSQAPAANDTFLVQPTAQVAGTFAVPLTSSSQLAAAGAVATSAANTNGGTGAISAGTVLNAANPALLSTATIQFTSPTTYTITTGANTGAPAVYTPGTAIAANGWQVKISGSPATGDTFTVQSNAGGTGDNRNALAAAALQSQGILSNGSISVNGAVSGLITSIGSQAAQINTAQSAQSAINTQALSAVQSVSGVNLDEEAANLMQWQAAYTAAAKAITIGNSLFTTLLQAFQ